MSDLTPEAAAVVSAATMLIDMLRGDVTVSALGGVLMLQRALDTLEEVERRKFAREQRAGIERAVGLARTHCWVLNDSGTIRCARCPVDASVLALENGKVPACDPDARCADTTNRHFISDSGCVFCTTTYPATVDARGGVSDDAV